MYLEIPLINTKVMCNHIILASCFVIFHFTVFHLLIDVYLLIYLFIEICEINPIYAFNTIVLRFNHLQGINL